MNVILMFMLIVEEVVIDGEWYKGMIGRGGVIKY